MTLFVLAWSFRTDYGATPQPSPPSYAQLSGPVPTNEWWTSLAYVQYSETLFSFPLASKVTSEGLQIDYPGEPQVVLNGITSYVISPFNPDFTVSFVSDTVSEAVVTGFSDWGVRFEMRAPSGTISVEQYSGSPFIYLSPGIQTLKISFVDANFDVLSIDGTVLTPSSQVNDSVTSDAILVRINTSGIIYGFFGRKTDINWTKSGTDITVSGLDGYMSLALLPDIQYANIFYQHAYAKVNETQIQWRVFDDRVETTYYWMASSVRNGFSSTPIYCMFPHHYKWSLQSPLEIGYKTLRGVLKLYIGDYFTTCIPYYGILPYLPAPWDSAYDSSYMNFLLDHAKNYVIGHEGAPDEMQEAPGDTYWRGKFLCRCADLIPVSAELNREDAKQYFVQKLRSALENWFTYTAGETSIYFALYGADRWGGVIGYQPSYNSENFTDHHFHYGYFVYAASILGLFDKDFLQAWSTPVEYLIKDYACSFRNESYFPFLRNMSVYEGHSFADGYGAAGDGNNQESTSEAMNSWFAVYLYGLATGNKLYRDLGIWGYVTEWSSLRDYWMDVDDDIQPSDWPFLNYTIVWGGKADHTTFFGTEPEYIYGIQMIPVTSASLYWMYDNEYAEKFYSEMINLNGGPEDEWQSIIWKFRSLFDAQAALSVFNSKKADLDLPGIQTGTITPDSGDTWAEVYYFICSLKSLGEFNKKLYCSVPSYAVFNNGEKTYYVVYNAKSEFEEAYFYSRQGNECLGYVRVPPNSLIVTDTLLKLVSSVSDNDSTKVKVYPVPVNFSGGESLKIQRADNGEIEAVFLDLWGRILGKVKTSSGYATWKKESYRGMFFVSLRINGKRYVFRCFAD